MNDDAAMATRILMIEDDARLAEMVARDLGRSGLEVTCAGTATEGLARIAREPFDLVLLDLMLPDADGLDVCRRLRATGSGVPVIMLTAKGDPTDRVVGLELGADDYVPKPCTPRELVARLRAILRRSEAGAAGPGGPVTTGPLSLWPERRHAEWEGRPIDLTSTEFNLLEVLARSAGRVVTKAELSEQGLGRPLARFDRSIDVHVSSLRQKVGRLADGRSYIQTVRGLGYQLVRE